MSNESTKQDAEETLTIIEEILRDHVAKAEAMSPADFKTGQDHLSPAFREVNFEAAFRKLIEIWNSLETDLTAALKR